MSAKFLSKRAIWTELEARIQRAKRVRAAVAYVGQGGAEILRLRAGDRLVVDMSLRAVRAGATDPREVRKLIGDGVVVYSCETLHSKFFVVDDVVIAGSANASNRARDVLDEAALMTDDAAAVKDARAVHDALCSQLVREHYLAQCIEQYRPPAFVPGPAKPSSRKNGGRRLWIIGGLRAADLPRNEIEEATKAEKQAKTKIRNYHRAEVDYCHYTFRLKFFDQLRESDQIVTCVSDGRGCAVSPPGHFLGLHSYPRGEGKRRYLLQYESPLKATKVGWSRVSRALPPAFRRDKPRTVLVQEREDVDAILRLWDEDGRFVGAMDRPRRASG